MSDRLTFAEIEAEADRLSAAGAVQDSAAAAAAARRMLAMGDMILETWLEAKGQEPTTETHEGFRLIALHRQAARGNPSFNACRETCRELVYHHNLILHDLHAERIPQTIRLGAMVLRHLALFVGGKLEADGLGDFCCSSRPIRAADTQNRPTETM